ncbi:PEP-CTERM sorting domain-containing protein [Nitrosospira multiformis]|uniref:PEP-CTERM sorting domain-containing protein n=1 Tax=Nitrosospira multiformis TaxID=1231 RepID=UPI00094476D2
MRGEPLTVTENPLDLLPQEAAPEPGTLALLGIGFARLWTQRRRMTQQPPAKAGGLGLRTESPDTRRLNDAS